MGLTILLVEDDVAFAKTLSRYLTKEGHAVEHAATGEQGVRLLETLAPDLVLMDLMLPGIDGLAALQKMKSASERVGVLVMTAHASVSTAVEAMRLGAIDYVTKPVDLEALSVRIAHAKEHLDLRSDLDYMLAREKRGAQFEDFIGDSPPMQAVYEMIRNVAGTDNTTVLVTGQSGTGKELVARAIHSQSGRSNKPLMQIDCTSIPLALLESELFGHERGAFTSAERAKKGLLELADGGTLLLDEIGDMAIELQSKFLRVLQERQFRRVGGTRDLAFDVRVIAATHQNLDRLVKQQRFRRDLLYRLKVFQIQLPPLSERGDDILKLAARFVEEFSHRFHKPVRGLSNEAERALLSYEFPGNVRELRNVIEQAVIRAKGELVSEDLLPLGMPISAQTEPPASIRQPALDVDGLGPKPLQQAERILIKQALMRCDGNKKQAAELLGISRYALQRKLGSMAAEMLGDDEA